MRRLFRATGEGFFEVPDGTLLNAFVNPSDATSGLPADLTGGVSIAAGEVGPGVVSSIHVMPHTTQITVLLAGALRVHMKDPGEPGGRYTVDLAVADRPAGPGFDVCAVLTRPGAFFQLDNAGGNAPARVLYVVSPSYVFLPAGPEEPPVYDDSVMIAAGWEELEERGWAAPELRSQATSAEARARAVRTISERRGATRGGG